MNDQEEIITQEKRDPSIKAISQESRLWWSGIKSGSIKFVPALPLLKKFIPAYIPKHVIVISGYTSAGKSQLLSQVAMWAAGTEEAPTAIFSLEDSRMEKMFSLVSCFSEDIHRKAMILGQIDAHKERIEGYLGMIEEWPLEIYDDVFYLHEMKDIIKKKKPRIVIIDYIQKVLCQGQIYDRMSYAAHETFRIAAENDCTMIIASQVSVHHAEKDNPNIIPLKGAGDLAEAAHAVVQLKKGRKEDVKHNVKIEIKKNKAFGNTGTLECRFNKHWTAIESDEEPDEIVI